MKNRIITILAVLFLVTSVPSFGQDFGEDRNWSREIGKHDDPYSRFDFSKYSQRDVLNAKNRYLKIEKSGFLNEWEGVYVAPTESGEALLTWNSSEGYVYTYIYHWLSSLDHGTVIAKHDHLRFSSESLFLGIRFFGHSGNFYKVTIGQKHYLIPEVELKEFGVRAGGREVSDVIMMGYFYRKDEEDVDTEGTPVFPERFAHLITKPIISRIVKVGPERVHQEKLDDGSVNYEEIHQFVEIAVGSKDGVRKGMDFYVKTLNEWIEIVSVYPTRSTGRLRRGIDDNRQPICYDYEGGNGQITPCKAIRIGSRAETKMNHYL